MVLPLALLMALPACADGGDDSTGGDGDGDGDGDVDMGSGGSASGGSSSGSGGGETIYASGSIDMDFNGTAVNFDVWESVQVNRLVSVGDSTNSETVLDISLSIGAPVLGEHDCTDSLYGGIIVGAENSEGEIDSFEAQGSSHCIIDVTEHGGPGKPLKGTFSAEVKTFLDETATLTNGTFDIIEASD